MELTREDKQIICNLLSQISVPVSQAGRVIQIISKLEKEPEIKKEEEINNLDKT